MELKLQRLTYGLNVGSNYLERSGNSRSFALQGGVTVFCNNSAGSGLDCLIDLD